MAEMGRVSRFFVNLRTGGRSQRIAAWAAPNLSLHPSAACLEIGCGNGELGARIVDALRPARYVATDLDARQLEVARRHLATRYPAGVPPALQVERADMLALPFPDVSFDAVFASYSLHHADEHHGTFERVPTALAEIDRVLRPGGRLVYVEFINKEKVRAWLTDHGYRVVAIHRGFRHERVVAAKPG